MQVWSHIVRRRRGGLASLGKIAGALAACCLVGGVAWAELAGIPGGPEWVVDPDDPGADLPPVGRSLFDHLVTVEEDGRRTYQVPFPFETLTGDIAARLRNTTTQRLQKVLIPIGRSLQRNAASPHYFDYPRAVVTAEADPLERPGAPIMVLKDRLHLGYQPQAAAIEVISWNEAAGRFEFQIVEDYRDGGQPKVRYVPRELCVGCHQNHAPIFADEPWNESNSNPNIARLLEVIQPSFYGISARVGLDIPGLIDFAVERGNYMPVYQRIWREGCGPNDTDGAACRAGVLLDALLFRLAANRHSSADHAYRATIKRAQRQAWRANWPNGLAIPSGRLLDRDPFTEPELIKIRFHLGPVTPARLLAELRDELPASELAIEDVLEPLYERPPHDVWSWPAGIGGWNGAIPSWFDGFIAGLADYFAPQDIARLDHHIYRQAVAAGRPTRDVSAACTVTKTVSVIDTPLTFSCGGNASSGADFGFVLRAGLEGAGPMGRISEFNLGAVGGAGDIEIVSGAATRIGTVWRAELAVRAVNGGFNAREQGPRIHARLANGETIHRVTLEWPDLNAGETGAGVGTVTLIDDFALIGEAVDWMVAETLAGRLDSLSNRAFRRVAVLAPIFDRLGMDAQPWCCTDSAGFPAPILSTE